MYYFIFLKILFIWERASEHECWGGAEGEADSPHDPEIMTQVEGRHLTEWVTQVPQEYYFKLSQEKKKKLSQEHMFLRRFLRHIKIKDFKTTNCLLSYHPEITLAINFFKFSIYSTIFLDLIKQVFVEF